MQIGREMSAQAFSRDGEEWNRFTLPDVAVWTNPGEHHEIKHKNPTRNGMFGLEVYRFKALLWFANETKQTVLYTIHNWELAGGKLIESLDINEWMTVDVLELDKRWSYTNSKHPSWINGRRVENVPQHFWSQDLWTPLMDYWMPESAQSIEWWKDERAAAEHLI